MIDPLPAPPQVLKDLSQPLADFFGLETLPLHAHEIVLAGAFYHILDTYLSPPLSSWAFPKIYPQLPPRTTVNWNIHMVSMVQSILICGSALWILLMDEERRSSDASARIWGYNGAAGMTQAFAAGYFAWDTVVSARHLDVSGWGALIHAISALVIVTMGFRPFANHYGIAFVLYELSTPFLNLHWFFDKCNMTGTRVQLYNGIMLIVVFCGCRLIWGTYQTVKIYQDLWSLQESSTSKSAKWSLDKDSHQPLKRGLDSTSIHDSANFPLWMVYLYVGSNTILTILNFFWFSQMLQAVRKRFPDTGKSEKQHTS